MPCGTIQIVTAATAAAATVIAIMVTQSHDGTDAARPVSPDHIMTCSSSVKHSTMSRKCAPPRMIGVGTAFTNHEAMTLHVDNRETDLVRWVRSIGDRPWSPGTRK
ncbi:hypothetical protein EV363DRAFT_383531 [Boletus edulis]|uniref:Uncharacterized protein n=1 Tax=Boletus edulis BED1 TaxID=1328754 RepID=A0AAD4C9H3_BOLED|nr:hypothetical protein EV363DRAFT_383531 [Boletus edulis]KAF8452419.1 hypothetical protein L210DRAFT_2033678 [Boletus edulis BED1]